MPARAPETTDAVAGTLNTLGRQIRNHRKALGVSATAAAEAAGMSRVTWHRIESGEPSVTMGAYLNAAAALGLDFGIVVPAGAGSAEQEEHVARRGWIPARIPLASYPQLKRIAWQVQGTGELTPAEALGIYERHWRHLDLAAMQPQERDLVEALRLALRDRAEPTV